MIELIRRRVSGATYYILEMLKAHFRIIFKSKELEAIRITDKLNTSNYIAIIVLKNEAHRVDYLLDYHQSLGFEQFYNY